MFRKTADFGHFGQFRPFPVAEPGRNCQKAHLQAKTFQISLFPGLYNHSLQSYSLEKPMFRKTAIFGHFDQFRPFPVAEPGRTLSKGTSTGQDLSYEPIPRSLRPSVTKIQPRKELMTDGQTDGRTDGHFRWPNLAKTVKRHIYRLRPFI